MVGEGFEVSQTVSLHLLKLSLFIPAPSPSTSLPLFPHLPLSLSRFVSLFLVLCSPVSVTVSWDLPLSLARSLALIAAPLPPVVVVSAPRAGPL